MEQMPQVINVTHNYYGGSEPHEHPDATSPASGASGESSSGAGSASDSSSGAETALAVTAEALLAEFAEAPFDDTSHETVNATRARPCR